jgi:hypothetical protein
MAKRQSVDDLYRDRSFPNGQVRGHHPLRPRDSDYGRHEELQKNQDPADRHASNYSNDVPANSWVRSDGTKKPSFDKSGAWRMKESNNWNSGHDPAVVRRPEKNEP